MRLPSRTRGIIAGLIAVIAGPVAAVVTSHTGSGVPLGLAAQRLSAVRIAAVAPVAHSEALPELRDLATPAPDVTPSPPPPVVIELLPTPTPTPSPPPPPPLPNYAPGTVQQIIVDAANRHGVSPSWMLQIAQCESGMNPQSYNPRGPYYGVFQFLMSTFTAHGGTNIWDAGQQADIAATMLANGGANAWTCA